MLWSREKYLPPPGIEPQPSTLQPVNILTKLSQLPIECNALVIKIRNISLVLPHTLRMFSLIRNSSSAHYKIIMHFC
jgi:hypothetical protein